MPSRVRFEQSELASGQHAITSPDVEGFCIVGARGDSMLDVERQAIEALMLLREHAAGDRTGIAAIDPVSRP